MWQLVVTPLCILPFLLGGMAAVGMGAILT